MPHTQWYHVCMTTLQKSRTSTLGRVFLIIVFLMVLVPAHGAQALSCARPDPVSTTANGGSIVFGTVTSVVQLSMVNLASGGYQEENRVTMNVEKGWGIVTPTISFLSSVTHQPTEVSPNAPQIAGGPMISSPFLVGTRYAVIINEGRAKLGTCSVSTISSDSARDAEFIATMRQWGLTGDPVYPVIAPAPYAQSTYYNQGNYYAQSTYITDEETPQVSHYCPILSSTIQIGARDSLTNPRGQVSELQRFLADWFDVDERDLVTGYFGRNTRMYVQKLQQQFGLPSFGIAGAMTRAVIARECR